MVIKNKKISQEEFLNIVRQEWHDFDNNILLQCIDSMRDWVKACIDAEGGQTNYWSNNKICSIGVGLLFKIIKMINTA